MSVLPILTLNLLDVKISENSSMMTAFINGIRETATENKDLFEQEDIPVDIFHNDKITYSGVQFTRYHGAFSVTGVGYKEVRAVEIWYRLFQKNTGGMRQNSLTIKEEYIPELTKEYLTYEVSKILLKSEIAEELKTLKNEFAINDRLEKYLYGNIKAFLIRVAGMELCEDDFISVRVKSYKSLGLFPTFHGGKLAAFDIYFSANVLLPHCLRLGQSVSLGYGNVYHVT